MELMFSSADDARVPHDRDRALTFGQNTLVSAVKIEAKRTQPYTMYDVYDGHKTGGWSVLFSTY